MRIAMATIAAVVALAAGIASPSSAATTAGDVSAANGVLSRVAGYPVILNCDEAAWNQLAASEGQAGNWHIFVWSANQLQNRDGVTLYLRPDYCTGLAALQLDWTTVDTEMAAEASYWVVASGIALQSLNGPAWSLNGSWDTCRAVSALGSYLPDFGVAKTVRGVVGTKVTKKLVRVIKKTVKLKNGKKKTIVVRRIYTTVKTTIYGDVPNPQLATILSAAKIYTACP
jgi:hypothetical protein